MTKERKQRTRAEALRAARRLRHARVERLVASGQDPDQLRAAGVLTDYGTYAYDDVLDDSETAAVESRDTSFRELDFEDRTNVDWGTWREIEEFN